MVICRLVQGLITAVLAVCFGAGTAVFAQIVPANHADGDLFYTPAALLSGTLPAADHRILAENFSSSDTDRITAGTVVDGRFKILIPLQMGENRIALFSENQRIELTLFRRPAAGPKVQIIWFCAKGEPALDPAKQAALNRRLGTGAALLQIATAERGNLFGTSGETFSLPGGDTPSVVRKTGSKTAEEYRQMGEKRLFDEIYRELSVEDPERKAVWLVFLSFAKSKGDYSQKMPLAASGADHIALLGLAGIDLWPESLADVYSVLTDTNPCRAEDERIDRPTVGGSAAATLGFTLHELGHAFGLPDRQLESVSPLDVMNRGFLYFDRIFLPNEVEEPFLER